MKQVVAFVFVSVALGGGFGNAAASATVNNDGTLDVQLQVEVVADTVVAHVIEPGGSQETISLVRRADGTFGGTVTTPRANRVVVFEALVGDESTSARPVTLLDLGVPGSLIGVDGPDLLTREPGSEAIMFNLGRSETIWMAVALLAVALALVAWWAAGPRSRSSAALDDKQNNDDQAEAVDPNERPSTDV